MTTDKQTIEAVGTAGGLLSRLADIFFKGLDGLLNSAAEYEEEFGVLKQVTKIPLVADNGYEYILTIKLSPIKDKDSFYYVEASTNAPNFDVSSINKKTIKINKTNKQAFDKIISDLISENNLSVDDTDDSNTKENNSENEEKSSDAEMIDKIISEVEAKLKAEPVYVSDDAGKNYLIIVEFDEYDEGSDMIVGNIGAADDNGEFIRKYGPTEFDIEIDNGNGNLIDADTLWDDLIIEARAYVDDNDFIIVEDKGLLKGAKAAGIGSSTSIKATFVKSSDSNQLELKAISATSDLAKAMSAIYDVANDDDFVSMLSAEPQSFEILDLGDSYDVNPIDQFDTCCIVRSF